MIYNIRPGTFGTIRMGDLVAVCNLIQHLRIHNHPDLKFYLEEGSMASSEHVKLFYEHLLRYTDLFAKEPGTETLPWKKVNLWDFRAITKDVVSLPNREKMQRKIVIFPLYDAPYNTYRNWPPGKLTQYLRDYSFKYPNYEKIICVSNRELLKEMPDEKIATISTDFLTNLWHIRTAEIFVGGDTGTTHFAFSLDYGPKELVYCMSGRGLLHTAPFHLLSGKGKLDEYWMDFEGSTFA